jgi:hypothetical protein
MSFPSTDPTDQLNELTGDLWCGNAQPSVEFSQTVTAQGFASLLTFSLRCLGHFTTRNEVSAARHSDNS